jgi:hypothetical protein
MPVSFLNAPNQMFRLSIISLSLLPKTENRNRKTVGDPRHFLLPLFYHKYRGRGKGLAPAPLLGIEGI